MNGRFVKAGTLAIIKPAFFFVPEIGAYVMVGSFTLKTWGSHVAQEDV